MDCYVTDFNSDQIDAVALEDCIMKKGSLSTAGSKMLDSFLAPFDAEVVSRLEESGIEIAGKTVMKEFGMNDLVEKMQGDLLGASQAVKDNKASACLCNDLFGRYRQEAAENQMCYIQPTYGTVSRYGLIPMASSMDGIGVLCRDAVEGFDVLSKIAGSDHKDGAMYPEKKYVYQKSGESITLCVPSEVISQTDAQTQKAVQSFAEKFSVVNEALPYFHVLEQTMYVLSCAEISNNINRYDGVKFGYRSPNAADVDSLYKKTRTEALGLDVKLAAIMGAMVLSGDYYAPYYEKAMKIRRLFKQALTFESYDVMILPVSIGSDPYKNLSLYAASALAGLPSLSFSYEGCGIQLIAGTRNENALLTAWEVSRQ